MFCGTSSLPSFVQRLPPKPPLVSPANFSSRRLPSSSRMTPAVRMPELALSPRGTSAHSPIRSPPSSLSAPRKTFANPIPLWNPESCRPAQATELSAELAHVVDPAVVAGPHPGQIDRRRHGAPYSPGEPRRLSRNAVTAAPHALRSASMVLRVFRAKSGNLVAAALDRPWRRVIWCRLPSTGRWRLKPRRATGGRLRPSPVGWRGGRKRNRLGVFVPRSVPLRVAACPPSG